MFLHTIILALALNFIYCQQNVTLDCRVFTHDYDIAGSLPFFLPFNPVVTNGKSYAVMNTLNQAIELIIYKQKSVPINIFCFKQLRVLKILDTPFLVDNNEISIYKVPDELKNLQTLTTLIIENSNVGENFTNALTQLSSLTELRIVNSSLRNLPSLASQRGLSILDLHSNPISQLLYTENLHYLTYVRLDGCSFSSLPKFTTLSGICISNCQQSVGWHIYYPRFIHFNVSGNQLSQIFEINRYKTLEELDLSYNSIQFLPPSISEVTTLKKLWLNNNRLVYVSNDILKLKQLQMVNLAYNEFPQAEITELKNAFLKNLPSAKVTF